MPIFMIERNFAEQLDLSEEMAKGINLINEIEGVSWLYSFLSADKKRTYCLYEASSAEAIRQAAKKSGIPADEVMELGNQVLPDGRLTEIPR